MKKKKLIKKTLKSLLHAMGIIFGFLVLGIGLIAGRLYMHPIEIKDYLPEVGEYLLPPKSGWKLEAESMILKTGFSTDGIFQVHVKNMEVLEPDGHTFLKLPHVVLSYRVFHLFTLSYVPDNIEIQDAMLRLTLDENGQLFFSGITDTEKPNEAETQIVVHQENPDRIKTIFDHLLSFHGLSLSNAEVLLVNKKNKRQVSLTHLNLDVERQFGMNHAIKAGGILNINDKLTNIAIEAQINKIHRKMSFDIEWDKLYLKNLSGILPVLDEAKLTTKGHVKGLFDFKKPSQNWVDCFKEGQFQIQILTPGTLNLPDPLTNLYHIQKAVINGAVGKSLNSLKIAKSKVYLTKGPEATLELEVSGLGEFLSGAPLNDVKTTLKSSISQLPIEQAPAIWPVATGPDAHAWVKNNLSKGILKKADFTLNFVGDELMDVYGEIPAENITVRYLDEMTPLTGFSGLVRLWLDKVIITGKQGNINHLQLKNAVVNLTELQDEISHAGIQLAVAGPVDEAMSLIAEKPLEFPQMFDLDPKETSGDMSLKVDLKFPLIDDLKTDDVKVDVNVKIINGTFPTLLPDKKLTDGKLDLMVNNKRLSLKGSGLIAEIPFSLEWIENFLAEKPTDIQSRYNLNANFDAKLLRGISPIFGEYIDGNLVLKTALTQNVKGLWDGNCQFDFKDSLLILNPISVSKEAGIPAKGNLIIKNDGTNTWLNFDIAGFVNQSKTDPIDIKGSAEIGDKTLLKLEKIIAPQSDFNAEINMDSDKSMKVKIQGNSWNAVQSSKGPKDITPLVLPPNMDFDIDLKKIILVEDKPLTNLLLKGKRENNQWQSLSGNLMSYIEPFNFFYNPKNKTLTATTNDMGDLMERLDLTKKFSGGHLDLEATQDENGNFEGLIEVKNFEMKEPGFLVQAATILGILDGILGKTLKFDSMEIPFQLIENPSFQFNINEGHMAGSSLGITFNGSYARENINIAGSVIPAYAINSLPGKIPFIGGLFKNGEGGGLVGLRYEVTGTQAKREINFKALGSMAPGILGKIFN